MYGLKHIISVPKGTERENKVKKCKGQSQYLEK